MSTAYECLLYSLDIFSLSVLDFSHTHARLPGRLIGCYTDSRNRHYARERRRTVGSRYSGIWSTACPRRVMHSFRYEDRLKS